MKIMYTGEISLILLKILGFWPNENSKGYLTFYNFYTIFISFILIANTASNLFYVLTENFDDDGFIQNFFYSLALLSDCIKIFVVYKERNRIRKIRNYLNDKQFEPRDSEELCIQTKYDKMGRTGTIIFLSVLLSTTVAKSIFTIIKAVTTSTFFETWMPFNNANRIFFWLTFLHDSFGGPIAGQATVACDSFIMIMILQLTAQMEILIHRMQIFFELCKIKIPNNPHMEQIILKNWVQHHNSLHLLKNELNDIFNSIFYIQFMLTTLSACLLTFQLTTIDIISTKFFTSIMQLFCVLLQICMYCATGNLIMEKSRAIGHAVFAMNWVSLTKRTKTGLIQIIMRANTPITFTAGSIIPLSLSTFTSILRLSYSIYNCLPKQ